MGLDVGCGAGTSAHRLSEKTGIEFLGIDSDSFAVDASIPAVRRIAHRILFRCDPFDVAFLNSVCEHI